MPEIIEKIQSAMNIAAGIRPRVDQVNEITLPLVNVINLLADARDSLTKAAKEEVQTPKAEG